MTQLERHLKAMFEHFDALYAPERKVFVPGEGNSKALLTLVGEAPGAKEVQLMRPFVGKAGANLDRLFEVTGVPRERVYITNVVKFRPVKVSEKGRLSNRAPTREEVELWTPWLKKELALTKSPVVVALGNVPLRALTGDRRLTIGKAHGHAMAVEGVKGTIFPLYHPASLIYNRALIPVFEMDLQALKSHLAAKGT